MSRASEVTVLGEDARHQSFVRRYLYRLGYGLHQIRFLELPGDRGCGEKWVREHYASEVRKCRTRSARARTALIVVIDADISDLARRARQLHDALDELPARMEHEAIVHFIPKRNVETWILCLSDILVDEITDYSRRDDIDPLIPAAAETFFKWARVNVTPSDCIPSLLAAIPEARRLESR